MLDIRGWGLYGVHMHTTGQEALPMELNTTTHRSLIDDHLRRILGREGIPTLDETNPDYGDPMLVGMWVLAEIGADCAGYSDPINAEAEAARRVAAALAVLNFGTEVLA